MRQSVLVSVMAVENGDFEMTWKHVSHCLPAELRADIAKKGAEVSAPAQVSVKEAEAQEGSSASRERMNAALPDGRDRRTHPKASLPQLGVRRPMLFVIEGGGGPARAQGGVSPGRLCSSGERAAREWVKLVHS
jgi:hypothetical protein